MTIIIKTPQPDVEERLVLVPPESCTPVFDDGKPAGLSIRAQGARDATPADLERAGLVLREQAAPGTLAHLRADLRDMTARAEKAELDAAEWAAEVDALRAEALAELADARRERDTLLAELADAKAECQGAMLSAYAQYAETVRERDEAKELARVLEVERDTLRAELADAKAERDRAIRDCAATAAERNEARAEVARLGVAHERARQQPGSTFVQATGTHTFGGRPRSGQGLPPDAQPDADRATDEELVEVAKKAMDACRAGEFPLIPIALAVAARVRQERCLVTRAVGMLADVSLARHPQRGLGERTYTIRVQCPAEPNAIAAAVPAADVPATLARLLWEVE